MVSVIIPTMKGREKLLDRLVYSLPEGVEIVIMDDEKMLLAEKRNEGAKRATGEYLLFIDDDNYIEQGAIGNLLPCEGINGMMACYDKDIFKIADGGSNRGYISGFMQGINTNKNILTLSPERYEVDEVANAFMIPRYLFFRLGGFDQKRFPIELDEADLCYRAKKLGFKVMMCPEAKCFHKSITYSYIPDFRRPRSAYFMGRNRILFQRKHQHGLKLAIYMVVFMPIFVILYSLCLLGRGKPIMLYHFLTGVLDGLSNRTKNKHQ